MPHENKYRRKRRRKKKWSFNHFWNKMAARHGNYFYNALFFGLLSLVALFLIFYFLGWLEFIGLRYEPAPPKLPRSSGK